MSTRRRRVLALTGLVAAASASALLVLLIGIHRYHPPSQAMSPTIKPGDWIWTRSTTGHAVHRGDIILLITPRPVGVPARRLKVVSRVVAEGGDTVEALDGELFVNGRVVTESYVRVGLKTPHLAPTHVPTGSVYVLGDNRENSAGSQVLGPAPFSDIKERVVKLRAPSTPLVVGLTILLCLPFLATCGTAFGNGEHRRIGDGLANLRT